MEETKDPFDATVPIEIPPVPAPRSDSLTIRLTAEEASALEAMARRLGVGKSSLARIFLRQGLGLGKPSR